MTLANPLSLANWTLPVIELLMVAGAIGCLVHAVRWYRQNGDASNVVIWISSVVGLLLIEPMAYFPQWFGLEKTMGLTFVHNQFSVQFMFDRLPLYIIAMYPVFAYLSYVLVQRAGIFAKYNTVIGAASVAFAFHCLFEVIDTIGAQWRWWAWNTELPTSVPALGVVPYLNIQVFTICLPFGLVAVTRVVSTARWPGAGRILRDVVIVSILLWPVILLASAPASIVHALGGSILVARAVSLWVYIVIVAAVGIYTFVGAYRARREDPDIVPAGVAHDYFPLIYGLIYLGCGALFWALGLGDYLGARNGLTVGGAPIGSLPYAVLAFIGTALVLALAYARTTGSASNEAGASRNSTVSA
ncbi:hypothetical protein [Mycobacterium sp. 94-17]|uniref:hypothetical protein n=1 Tax=Mycobacterium sp. 94-17 TaxID=2986147 RepID=UPI002D1F15C4|nr:hypothetical protein [Mycobacterium sp. 94-17]MEB4209785.1 hypothetical protein [Mycobacterium sp. 94-17]